MIDHYVINHMTKQYNNYRFNTRIEAFAELHRGPPNKDRMYMHQMLKPVVEYLERCGVSEYQDFVTIFKEHNFKMNDIKNFIAGFKKFINSQNDNLNINKIDWIKDRELSKSNFGEKNLLLNKLAFQYQKEILIYTRQLIQNQDTNIINKEIFIPKFEKQIQQLTQSSSI